MWMELEFVNSGGLERIITEEVTPTWNYKYNKVKSKSMSMSICRSKIKRTPPPLAVLIA